MEVLTSTYVVSLVGILWMCYRVYILRNPNYKCNGVLPPGSTGLPFLGETIQFFSPYSLYDIPPFIKYRMSRYGSLFKTSIVGLPMVVSTDPEINHYILQQDKKFQCWYTSSFMELLGKDNVMGHHKYLKNLILHLVSPANLKENLLVEMDQITRDTLRSWSSQGNVDVKEASADMIFAYAAKKLMNYDETKASKNLRGNYKAFMDGLISFPLNIPGTAFHACWRGRENAMKTINAAIFERRLSKEQLHHDFLDYLLEEVNKKETIMNEEIAADLIFVLLFATYETTSTAMTLATKFLNDHPAVLNQLTKEHMKILENRGEKEAAITWTEYKSLTFTHMVINETVRLANIVPGIFRRVIKDVELKGYKIPAGWTVMICPPTLHLDSTKYDNPLEFNPWRWKGEELHSASKDFMAFGGGTRLCVGADFAKLQMAIYLHYLVTEYSWKVTKGGEIIRQPGLVMPKGLHVQISELQHI